VECGTHVIFDAAMTTVKQGEISSVLPLIERQLGPGMRLVCDAGNGSCQGLFAARRKGAHVLGRLDSRSYKLPWARLHDGSYLVKIAGEDGQELTARVLEYQVKDPQRGQLSEPIRLITTVLDQEQYPIEALIRGSHERS
jgi:hypothetical protein